MQDYVNACSGQVPNRLYFKENGRKNKSMFGNKIPFFRYPQCVTVSCV